MIYFDECYVMDSTVFIADSLLRGPGEQLATCRTEEDAKRVEEAIDQLLDRLEDRS
jgi:hypothetical protein